MDTYTYIFVRAACRMRMKMVLNWIFNRYWINFPLLHVFAATILVEFLLQFRYSALFHALFLFGFSIFLKQMTTIPNKWNMDDKNALLFSLYCPGPHSTFFQFLSLFMFLCPSVLSPISEFSATFPAEHCIWLHSVPGPIHLIIVVVLINDLQWIYKHMNTNTHRINPFDSKMFVILILFVQFYFYRAGVFCTTSIHIHSALVEMDFWVNSCRIRNDVFFNFPK